MTMMKTKLLALSLLLIPVALYSQSTQKGKALLINSQKKPLPGVEVAAHGASSSVSDINGNFTLTFPHSNNGELIFVESISKMDYELANEAECKEWMISEHRIYEVVMCPKGYLEATKRKYYKIGDDRYKKRYNEQRQVLDSQKKLNEISESDYMTKISAIHNEYTDTKKQLDFYADKFSRINKDDLHGIDSVAMAYLERGAVDSAIIVYERSNILEDFLQMMESRNLVHENMADIAPMLVQQINLCIKGENPYYILMAEKIIKKLLEHYPNNNEYIDLEKQITAIKSRIYEQKSAINPTGTAGGH